jgi:hypothetical protein
MEGWLFQTPAGTQLDPSNVRKVFNKLLTAAKLGGSGSMTFAIHLLPLLIAQSESLAYIRDQMGHSSIDATFIVT